MHAAVAVAQEEWIQRKVDEMNPLVTNPSGVWNAINAIRAGLGLKSQTKVPMMKKPDGSKCTTSDESAEVFAEYFTGVFGHDTQVEMNILDKLDQIPPSTHLEDEPPPEEIARHTSKMKCGKAAGSDGVSPDLLKALAGIPEADELMNNLVLSF